MKTIGIYKITSPSGKVYIGQSWDVKTRKVKYSTLNCKKQPGIYRSLVKYGWNNHVFQVIVEFNNDCTQEKLDKFEILYMQIYREQGVKLLNVKDGRGDGKHSIESKKKMSESGKGKIISEETKKKISLSLQGKIISTETRRKISLKLKNRSLSPETKKKLSEAGIIRMSSEKARNRIRIMHTGRKHSEESKQKISVSNMGRIGGMRGKKQSESVRYKITQSNLKRKVTWGKKIEQLSRNNICLKTWLSAADAAIALHITRPNINACLKNRRVSAGGFKWKYIN